MRYNLLSFDEWVWILPANGAGVLQGHAGERISTGARTRSLDCSTRVVGSHRSRPTHLDNRASAVRQCTQGRWPWWLQGPFCQGRQGPWPWQGLVVQTQCQRHAQERQRRQTKLSSRLTGVVSMCFLGEEAALGREEVLAASSSCRGSISTY